VKRHNKSPTVMCRGFQSIGRRWFIVDKCPDCVIDDVITRWHHRSFRDVIVLRQFKPTTGVQTVTAK